MKNVYTAILIKPEGSYISDSRYITTSSSDYNIFSSSNKQELIEYAADITSEAELNARKFEHYEEYEVTFLFNGYPEQGDLFEEIEEISEIKSEIDLLYDMWYNKHHELLDQKQTIKKD